MYPDVHCQLSSVLRWIYIQLSTLIYLSSWCTSWVWNPNTLLSMDDKDHRCAINTSFAPYALTICVNPSPSGGLEARGEYGISVWGVQGCFLGIKNPKYVGTKYEKIGTQKIQNTYFLITSVWRMATIPVSILFISAKEERFSLAVQQNLHS